MNKEFLKRMQAQRAATVTTTESVNKTLHPSKTSSEPQDAAEPVKAISVQENVDAVEEVKAAPETRPALRPSQMLAQLQATKQDAVVTSASDLARKAQEAATSAKLGLNKVAAQPSRPVVTKAKTVMPTIRTPTKAMVNTAAEVHNIISKANMSDQQSEQIRELEGLNADLFMQDMIMLEHYLTSDVEDIATLQQRTHQNLRQYPELTTILSDEQIGVVVGSIFKRKNIEVVTPSKGKGSANVKNLTEGMSVDELLDAL